MKASFEDWRKNGWLNAHQSSWKEIADLFAIADRDLSACQTPGLINDWRFNIAYNAALQLASAALAASGYEAERANHHYRVIQSLELTLGLDPATVRKFHVFRKKRNITDYEKAHSISEIEAKEMRQLAEMLRREVHAWLGKHHPTLRP